MNADETRPVSVDEDVDEDVDADVVRDIVRDIVKATLVFDRLR